MAGLIWKAKKPTEPGAYAARTPIGTYFVFKLNPIGEIYLDNEIVPDGLADNRWKHCDFALLDSHPKPQVAETPKAVTDDSNPCAVLLFGDPGELPRDPGHYAIKCPNGSIRFGTISLDSPDRIRTSPIGDEWLGSATFVDCQFAPFQIENERPPVQLFTCIRGSDGLVGRGVQFKGHRMVFWSGKSLPSVYPEDKWGNLKHVNFEAASYAKFGQAQDIPF